MTQEDKELLLKDLCARLPYGVKVDSVFINPDTKEHKSCGIEVFNATSILMIRDGLGEFTPYLFPISSMTEEQLKDVKASLHQELIDIYENGSEERKVPEYPQTWYYVQDWYNAHHFDYRGLIEKGLAINATGLNIY